MLKVLVVDDAAFMRNMLKDILHKNGFIVAGEASNGIEAIEKYKEVKPDIVTMDVTMPLLNGIEATKGITEHDCNAKIVMCSAMGQQGMVIDAIKAGACDFIVKPFKADLIVDTIRKHIG